FTSITNPFRHNLLQLLHDTLFNQTVNVGVRFEVSRVGGRVSVNDLFSNRDGLPAIRACGPCCRMGLEDTGAPATVYKHLVNTPRYRTPRHPRTPLYHSGYNQTLWSARIVRSIQSTGRTAAHP